LHKDHAKTLTFRHGGRMSAACEAENTKLGRHVAFKSLPAYLTGTIRCS
jgi:hypothetical protein